MHLDRFDIYLFIFNEKITNSNKGNEIAVKLMLSNKKTKKKIPCIN